jgi:GNAT superfamily N-acetyltransferase
VTIAYAWRGDFLASETNVLHAEAFGHPVYDDDGWDWRAQVERHSLGWVTARDGAQLVGFVNVAWDGQVHAFVLDTMVAEAARRRGIGKELVAIAVSEARRAGCEWLHVDFEDHLRDFYVETCGFAPANAGLIAL